MTISNINDSIMPSILQGPPAKRARREEGSSVVGIWDRSSSSSSSVLDRIIPNRLAMEQAQSAEVYTLKTPRTLYQKALTEAAFPNYSQDRVLLHKPAKPFQANSGAPVWKIPNTFYLSLEAAEESIEDFYMHPLDWGHRINYAVDSTVFSVDPLKKDKITLAAVADSVFVSCVKSSSNLQQIAIGDSKGTLSLFDLESQVISLNKEFGNADSPPIFCVGWRSEISELTLGLDSSIIHVDKRLSDPAWTFSLESGQRICSIDWNRSQTLMGTGNAANLMRVFDLRYMQEKSPVYTLESKGGPIKALQWNPQKSDLLMGGAGILDRHLYIMDLKERKVVCKENVGSPVCDLTWLDDEHVVLGAGDGDLEPLSVWRYTEKDAFVQKIKGIVAQRGQILNVVKDPKSADFCSHSSAETLCFWHPEKIAKESEGCERRIAQRPFLKPLDIR